VDEKYHGPFGKKEFLLSRTGRGVYGLSRSGRSGGP
jgi:hypothetical protein